MAMIDQLIEHFENRVSLSEEEKEWLRQESIIRTVNKNDYLLKEGQISDEFFFIFEGCVRLYYQAGIEEKTAFFYTENMFVSSYESFTKRLPAKHSFQAIEDTQVAVFNSQNSLRLIQASPTFEALARIIDELDLYPELSKEVTRNEVVEEMRSQRRK